MSNINIIFYSKKCSTCFKLLQVLEAETFLKYFKLVCIDDKIDMLPPQITAVPTMIVRNINKPLNPEECFKWVKSMIDFRDNNNKNTEIDVQGFTDLEYNKFSDIFTFIKTDDPLAQTFHKYKDEKNNAIYTAPLEGKLGPKDQTKKIKELEVKRSQQDTKFKLDMKTEQKEKMLKNKK